MKRSIGQNGSSLGKTWYRVAAIVTITMLTCAVLIWGVSQFVGDWSWTGFNGGYEKITRTETTPSITTSTPSKTVATEQSPPKSLWDILQLLIVPFVLAGVGLWFSQAQKRNEQQIASDDLCEKALQNYIDKISELLLLQHSGTLNDSENNSNRNSTTDSDQIWKHDHVREIVRVRTLTVLLRLDPLRKKYVLQFLYAAKLISANDSHSIDLENADFREADLEGVQLDDTNLKKVIFTKAQLNEIKLNRALLEHASLREANLYHAELNNAHLEHAILNEANLRTAKLNNAHLDKASLIKADLRNADLTDAVLTETDLRNAKLTNATVSIEQLNVAINVTSSQRSSIKQQLSPRAKEKNNVNQTDVSVQKSDQLSTQQPEQEIGDPEHAPLKTQASKSASAQEHLPQ